MWLWASRSQTRAGGEVVGGGVVCYLKWWWPRASRSQTRVGGEGVGGGRWWCGVLLEVVAATGIVFANASGGRGVAPPAVPACLLVPACACARSFVCSFVFIHGLFVLTHLCWSPLPGLLSLSFVCVKYKVSKYTIIKLLTLGTGNPRQSASSVSLHLLA